MINKLFWAFTLMLLLTSCNALAWHGTVVDKETGQQIEGVVIVRSWVRESASPAGSVTSFLGMKETLTDNKGNFAITRGVYFPGIPFLSAVVERKPVVYKPGYKFLILNEKKSVIEIEKIPTFLNLRKEELSKAESNYEINKYVTKIFKDIVSKEEEFIRSPEYPIKLAAAPAPVQAPLQQAFITSGSHGLGIAHVIPQNEEGKKAETKERRDLTAHKDDMVALNIRVLEDRSIAAPTRSGAAASLGYYKDPRAVPSLINALNDDAPIVRYQAAVALRKLKDSRAVVPLINAVRDEHSGVRREAIVALGELKNSRAVPSLINALKDRDKGVRFEAATVLGKFKDPRAAEAVEPLIHDLSSQDINIQQSASYALVQIGKPAVEPLVKALRDSDKTIRREAALALGGIGETKSVEPLIELLNANQEGVSWAAAIALGNFNDPRAAKALVTALRFKDGYLRSRLSAPMLQIGSLAIDYLIIALKDKDPEVRAQAALILGYSKDSRSVEPLMYALKDDNSQVRRNAVIGLLFLKDSRAVHSLISAWSDTDSEVRTKASEAVVSIGREASEQLLVELQNKNSYMRWRAAWCLGRIKEETAVEVLAVLLNDKVTEVQWIAIDALSEIGGNRAYESLVALCHAKDAGIREKIESTIIKLTGKNICEQS